MQGDFNVSHENTNEATFLNKTALNASRFNEELGSLLGYQRGSPITVTYFRRMISEDNIKTIDSDYDILENDIHVDLEQINNFEFRVSGAFSFSWEEGEASSVGEGTTYPGFEPKIGDMFIYSTGKHEALGLYVVSNVEPLSLRQGAYHRINFYLKYRLSPKQTEELHKRIHSTVYFDKQKFLSENITLLNYTSAIQLNKLRKARIEIAKYYANNFYDRSMYTYMRPDGYYDPYVITYINKKLSIPDVKVRPEQLVPIYDYNKSIWSLFTDSEHVYLKQVYSHYYIVKREVMTFNTGMNSLINRPYVQLGEPSNDQYYVYEPYLFDPIFYINYTLDEHPNNIVSLGEIKHKKIKYVNKDKFKKFHEGHKEDSLKENEEESIDDEINDNENIEDDIIEYEEDNDEKNIHQLKKKVKKLIKKHHHGPIIKSTENNTEAEMPPFIQHDEYVKDIILTNLVGDYISKGALRIQDTVDLVTEFRSLDPNKAFYQLPVYLHLIDLAIRKIT